MTSKFLAATALTAALFGAAPAFASTTIDFETDDTGAATTPNAAISATAYDALGVTITDAFFRRCGGGCPAPSNGTFISSNNFDNAFTVSFANAISNFTFSNVSNSGSSASAFGATGNLLGTISFSGFPASFTFNVTGIRSVTFGGISPVIRQFGVDDFSYDGSALGGVPEPMTWALMILGFGVVGSALRRAGRRRSAVTTMRVAYA